MEAVSNIHTRASLPQVRDPKGLMEHAIKEGICDTIISRQDLSITDSTTMNTSI